MKKYTPYNRIKKYVFDDNIFTNEQELQDYIRTNQKAPDLVAVNNILYTMEMYDHTGQYIVYANRRTETMINVKTIDRYKYGFDDAEVSEIDIACSYRMDINYYD